MGRGRASRDAGASAVMFNAGRDRVRVGYHGTVTRRVVVAVLGPIALDAAGDGPSTSGGGPWPRTRVDLLALLEEVDAALAVTEGDGGFAASVAWPG